MGFFVFGFWVLLVSCTPTPEPPTRMESSQNTPKPEASSVLRAAVEALGEGHAFGAVAGAALGRVERVQKGEDNQKNSAPDLLKNCPWGESLRLAAGEPWVLADVGVVLQSAEDWRVLGVDAMGWRLRLIDAPFEADLTISLRVGPNAAEVLRLSDRKVLLGGWQRRGFVIEQVSELGNRLGGVQVEGGLVLRMRSPEDRPVRVLYVPRAASLVVLTLEGSVGALARTLDGPLQMLVEGLSFLDTPAAHWSGGGGDLGEYVKAASGLAVRFGKEGQALPLAGMARLAWLDVGEACPLWVQFEVRVLEGEPSPGSPYELDRLVRGLVESARATWPDAIQEPLLEGRLGRHPAVRFALKLHTDQPARLSMPLPPPPHPQPLPWSVLGLVVVRTDAPPLLIRAWIQDENFAAAERRLSHWLERLRILEPLPPVP